ncbi:MAG: ABC transporter ATP-binding protein [Planctomycetes bacterium]|nr:ABC transporter ATP-binding protein [Planctomycetota bacterium]
MKDSSFARLYALLKPHVKPRMGELLLVFLLAFVAAFGQKLPILLIEPIWSRVLFPNEESPFGAGESSFQKRVMDWIFGTPEQSSVARVLWTVAILQIVIALITAASEYAYTWLSRRVSLRMIVDLRLRIARHLMGLSMRYHGERRFGDLLSRVASDVSHTLACVNTSLKDVLQGPLLVLGSLFVAFWAAPLPTLAVVLFLPVLAIPIGVMGRKVRKRSTKSLTSLGASVQVLTQMIQGVRTVKAFRAEEREIARYSAANQEYISDSMRMVRAIARSEAVTALFSNLGIAVLAVGIALLNNSVEGGLFANGGQMAQFFLGISLIYSHVKRFANAVARVQESTGAADRLQSLLDEPIDVREVASPKRIQGLGSGLRFEDVTFTYPAGERPALAEVELAIRPGETIALVGPSGGGKTTFIDLLARFMDPEKGRITVDGHDLRELSLDDWTGLYAMVGQVPFLFHASVLDNIRYGKPTATQAEVVAAARAANIHEFIESLPQGYETIVGDQGARLSGGQRQRITIARAFLKGAPLLLLDEATSALDSESEAVVQQALERLMHDRTVIVIAHRLSTVRNADRIVVLDLGRIVEIGTHAELVQRGGLYARLAAVQLQGDPEVSV